jgi:hypothetical protein
MLTLHIFFSRLKSEATDPIDNQTENHKIVAPSVTRW